MPFLMRFKRNERQVKPKIPIKSNNLLIFEVIQHVQSRRKLYRLLEITETLNERILFSIMFYFFKEIISCLKAIELARQKLSFK